MNIIGRKREQTELERILFSGRPEFLVVYGRRRVGKTFLIRKYFHDQFAFYATGVTGVSNRERLKAFRDGLCQYGDPERKVPGDWFDAFSRLRTLLENDTVIRDPASGRRVIFLDELPWMDSARSDFKAALDFFWNSYASAKTDILLIVCGSAASWIITNILNNTGGLYNRVTAQIHLLPFSLAECEEYYKSNDLPMTRGTALLSYMVFGGIPYYLNLLDRRLSLDQNIGQLIFAPTGQLHYEFDRLFQSLFKHSEKHIAVILQLSKVHGGLLRTELAKEKEIGDGEHLTKVLNELEQCGFIRKYNNFTKKNSGYYFQLIDPFTLFYIRFRMSKDMTSWMAYTRTPAYHAWCGLSFELICLLHMRQIAQSLGISGIDYNVFSWRSTDTRPGAQIDLLIDRSDNVINVCEAKFSEKEFTITAAYEKELLNKISAFTAETGTKKASLLTLITANGLKQNKYHHIVQRTLYADDLFVPL